MTSLRGTGLSRFGIILLNRYSLIPSPTDSCDTVLPLAREETDCGLLKLMADGKQPWADAAFRAFYERHSAYMWKVCADCARGLKGDVWIEDVFNDTFAKAYQKAHQFALPVGTLATEEELCVRGWLSAIAANFVRQKLRQFGREVTCDDLAWEKLDAGTTLATNRAANVPAEPRPERALIDAALASLSDREALVLRTTFQFYRTGEKFQRLPNKVAQDLAESLATTPENLRKIRERAMAKVYQYVEKHRPESQNKPA